MRRSGLLLLSWFFSLLSLTLLMLFLAPSFNAGANTTITVDTIVDDDTVNGNCTLREAIIAANTDAVVDNCPAGIGEDTIILPTGTYALSIAGSMKILLLLAT